MATNSEKLAALIAKAGINAKSVKVLGVYVHIDSFSKYHDKLVHLMTSAGFKVLVAADGFHMDGTKGYRASFKLGA